MSRIGKLPVAIPAGVTLTVDGNVVKVKGPNGELSHKLPDGITVAREGDTLNVNRASEETNHKSLHGLTRSLITGVGFKAEVRPYGLQLALGFSHSIEYKAPTGIKLTAPQPTAITITGSDKALVGQVAAELRGLRPPEPYKGKGIRYAGEIIRRKAGKAGGK